MKYNCTYCNEEIERPPSTVRNPNRVFCNMQCLGKYQKTELMGENNPNYSGKYNTECECGNKKDYRSDKCAICSGVSFPVGDKNKIPDNFKEVVSRCQTIIEVASVLGINRYKASTLIKDMNLDTTHFKNCNKRPISDEDLFTYTNIKRYAATKKRLFDRGIKEQKCEKCGINNWNGLNIILELHHIDGDPLNNNISNLKILCPNCHSQTTYYKGAGVRR